MSINHNEKIQHMEKVKMNKEVYKKVRFFSDKAKYGYLRLNNYITDGIFKL